MIIPAIVWTVPAIYFGRSYLSPVIFHRVLSAALLLFLIFVEAACQQTTKTGITLCWIFAAISFFICIALSPLQAFLFESAPNISRKSFDIYGSENLSTTGVDIVAVHGLGSKPDTAWSHSDDKGNWLRDFLLEDGLDARIIVYYHSSHWRSNALLLDMKELGRDLIRTIERTREQFDEITRATRPIIFLGYSFGGIIVKTALTQLDDRSDINTGSIGCVFLGTPHKGSPLTSVAKLLSLLGYWVGSSTTLLSAIEPDSKENKALHETFKYKYEDAHKRFVNVYEGIPEYAGPFSLIPVVSEESATESIGKKVIFHSSHRRLHRFREKDRDYQTLLTEIRRLIDEVKPVVEKEKREGHKMDQDWIDRLERADGAGFNEEEAPLCHQDTRVDLLQQIISWATTTDDTKSSRIFLLKGMAGTGKSTIARTVAMRLSELNFGVASFFFRRGIADRDDARRVVNTIVRQLSKPEYGLRSAFANAICQNPEIGQAILSEQWKKLIVEPLSTLSGTHRKKIIIIFDALDECGSKTLNKNSLMTLPIDERTLENLDMRLFITSRPEGRDPFEPANLSILHDIPGETVEQDIYRYLEYRFATELETEGRYDPPWPQPNDIRTLAQKSKPLFIVAATSFQFIAEDLHDPRECFKSLINGSLSPTESGSELDQMYLTILKYILRPDTRTFRRDLDTFRYIVVSVAILYDTLTIPALAKLLSRDEPVVKGFLRSFRSVLDFARDDKPVRLFHVSFRDFLFDKDRRDEAFRFDEKAAHTTLFHGCIDVMDPSDNSSGEKLSLKEDICQLMDPGFSPTAITTNNLETSIPAHLQYACKYWVHHFLDGDFERRGVQETVHQFLVKNLLHWLEAMSCLQLMSEAVRLVDKLEFRLTHMPSALPELSNFLSDAKRFVRYNRQIIEEAPLQLYSSALLFCPRNSIVRCENDARIARYIMNRPKTGLHWSASLQILEGHSGAAMEVRFSRDGEVLVTAAIANIIIWDAETGAMLETIKTMNQPKPFFAISEDGLIAFYTEQGSIGLWSIRSQRLLPSLHNGLGESTRSPNDVVGLAFSPNGSILATSTTSSEHAVELWDVTHRTSLCTLEKSGYPMTTIFSSSGNFLAAGFYRGLIKIWKVENRELHCAFECCKRLLDILFLPGDRMLVSGSMEEEMKLWNLEDKTLQKDYGNKSKSANNLVHLPKTNFLASSHGTDIKIWDLNVPGQYGSLVRSLEGHRGPIKRLVVSANGKILASSSYDGTIRLWNADTGELRNILAAHTYISWSICFSPDSRVIASAGARNEVMLWDAEKCLETQQTTDIRVNTCALSPDGTMVATESDTTIDIWNLNGESRLKTISTEDQLVTGLSFSPNSRLLAFSTKTGVEIWPVDEEMPQKAILPGTGIGEETSITFSSDGEFVAYSCPKGSTIVSKVDSGEIVGNFSTPVDEWGSLAIAFSHEKTPRKLLAVALVGMVYVWNLASGSLVKILELPGLSTGIAFSPTKSELVTTEDAGRTHVWDTSKFALLNAFKLPTQCRELSFCTEGCCVGSNRGVFSPGKNPLEVSSVCPDGHVPVFFDPNGWLLWRGRRFLWLPPEFRPYDLPTIRKGTLVVRRDFGSIFLGIFFLRLDAKRIAEAFGQVP